MTPADRAGLRRGAGVLGSLFVALPLLAGAGDSMLPFLYESGALPPTVAFVLVKFLVCAGVSGLIWLAAGSAGPPGTAPQAPRLAIGPRTAAAGLVLIVSLSFNRYMLSTVAWDIDPSRFFNELGWNAASVERLWHGMVFFKDSQQVYGYLMFLGPFLFTKIFGHTLAAIALWCLLFEMACFFLIFAALRFLTESPGWSLLGTAACVVLLYPQIPIPHFSHSRIHAAILPGLLTAWGLSSKDARLQAAGLAAAVLYFFYSYDYALVVAVAFSASGLAFGNPTRRRVAAASAAVAAPLVLYGLWLIRAIGAGPAGAVEMLFYIGGRFMSESASFDAPFPLLGRDAAALLAAPSAAAVKRWLTGNLAYWHFLTGTATMAGLWFGWPSRESDGKKFLCLYLALLPWGMSVKYISHVAYDLHGLQYFTAFPVILSIFWLSRLSLPRAAAPWVPLLAPGILAAWAAGGVLGMVKVHLTPRLAGVMASHPFNPFGGGLPTGYVPLKTPSSRGFLLPPKWRDILEPAVNGIIDRTRGSESLYVFPGDPILYFLLGKRNPVYTDCGGHIIPGGWERVLRELRKDPPPFVVLSRMVDPYFFDPKQAEGVRAFIGENYKETFSHGGIALLEKTAVPRAGAGQ